MKNQLKNFIRLHRKINDSILSAVGRASKSLIFLFVLNTAVLFSKMLLPRGCYRLSFSENGAAFCIYNFLKLKDYGRN